MIPQRTPALFLARCVFQTAGKTLSTEIYESYLLILQVGKLVPRDRKEIYNLSQRLVQVTGTKVWIHMDVRDPGCCPILYPTQVCFSLTLMGMPPYFITGEMKSEKQQGLGSPTMTQRKAKLNPSSAPEGRSFWHFQALCCPQLLQWRFSLSLGWQVSDSLASTLRQHCRMVQGCRSDTGHNRKVCR